MFHVIRVLILVEVFLLESFNSSIEAIRDGSIINRINLEPSDPLFMPLGSEKLSQEELKAIQDFSDILCVYNEQIIDNIIFWNYIPIFQQKYIYD